MKKYKLNEFDANSPGFLGRERKRLEVFRISKEYSEESSLENEVAYFTSLVEFLAEYVQAPIDELDGLSLNDLTELHGKVIDQITVKEEPDPKASAPTEDS